MEVKPSLDLVYLAVASLNNRNSSENQKASQWLNDLQKSVYAWTIADELLHQKKDLQSCYFAAQTMRSKIQHSFHELPQDAHDSLRNSLVEHISQIDENTNSAIVTQLCLALADLALQMTMWKRASLDLLNKFSQTNVWPLLEILTVLPEEVESRAIRLGENRRVELLQEFNECAPAINNFLIHCAHVYPLNLGENIPFNTKILRCFTSWVGAFNAQIILNNIVLTRAFDVLNIKTTENQEGNFGSLHDAARDCICSVLQSLIIPLNSFEDGAAQSRELEMFLFNNIVQLEEAYHMSVVKENEEKSINFCQIFTELAESFLETIILQSKADSFHYGIKALDLVLTCVGHHDYEVAEITFNLWYMLSEELYHKNNAATNLLFKPYVERLITALARHCQMESDQEGLLSDSDDFKDFRLKVSNLIKDIVFIVGSSNCFKHMFYNLQNPSTTWEVLEASLFVMQAVAKNILPIEDEIVPLVVESILNLQSNTMHIAVQHTIITLLGELCEWIEKHPNTLDPILNFLVPFLPQQLLGAAAATSLQNICVTCDEQMVRHVLFLMQILHQVDTFAISNDAVNGLLRGMAAIIGYMPSVELTVTLKEVCYLQVNPLCQLIDQDVLPVKGTKSDPALWLDRLASILRNVHIKHKMTEINPCKSVVLDIWPVISKTLLKYQSDGRIMERCCRCIRFMLRCVSQEVKEILEGLVRQIITIYSVQRHPCFLYLGSILVDEYANDSSCTQGLLDMLRAFIMPTFEILQKENGLRNHPDTVDDFFRLCARFMQRAPVSFLECDCINPVLQCALSACLLDHKEANASVMKFIYDLISTGHSKKRDPDYDKRKELVGKILNEIGQQLVGNLIQTSVFYLHSYMLCEVGDVLVELLEFNREMTEKWLMGALDQLPKQNNGVMAATPQQLKDVYIKISGSKASREITHELKILSRYYR